MGLSSCVHNAVSVVQTLSGRNMRVKCSSCQDMEQWMSVLETSNAESEVMLTETEVPPPACLLLDLIAVYQIAC